MDRWNSSCWSTPSPFTSNTLKKSPALLKRSFISPYLDIRKAVKVENILKTWIQVNKSTYFWTSSSCQHKKPHTLAILDKRHYFTTSNRFCTSRARSSSLALSPRTISPWLDMLWIGCWSRTWLYEVKIQFPIQWYTIMQWCAKFSLRKWYCTQLALSMAHNYVVSSWPQLWIIEDNWVEDDTWPIIVLLWQLKPQPYIPIHQVPEPKGVSRQEQASRRRAPNTVLVAKPRHKQDPVSFNTHARSHTDN